MGTYYKIVNIDRRQYFCPGDFGTSVKRPYFLSEHVAVTLSLLTARFEDPNYKWGLFGSWSGDRIFFVGDDSPPNTLGLQTATADFPERNLYGMAWREFEDISIPAIATLIAWREEVADELAKLVVENPYEGPILLGTLGDLLRSRYSDWIDTSEDRGLVASLIQHVGPNWEENYERRKAEWRNLLDYRDQ